MAQGNLILGTMKGKLGDVVAYNYNGKQAARVRRRQISNPKTSKQAIQRAIAATVAKFVSAFAPVLNNSLQSESTKVKSLAKIRSLNMTMLRQLAAQNLGTYAPKGSMYVTPNNYIISRGSLRGIEPLRSDSALLEMRRTISGLFNATDIVVNSSNSASQAFPGIVVGDQITIIATSHTAISDGSQVAMCRFAFKNDQEPAFLATEDEGEFLLNPAAIDLTKADGKYDELVFNSTTLDGSPVSRIHVGNLLGGVVFLDNFGLIVSREAGKLRSNARMVSVPDFERSLNNVYPTYMDGGTAIDMPSEVYLNNDANVSETAVGIQLMDVSSHPVVFPLSFSFGESLRSCAQLVGSDIPSFYLVRVTYTQNGVSKEATFYSNTSTTVDDVKWFITENNWISAQHTTEGDITVSVTSVKYSDRDGNVIVWD